MANIYVHTYKTDETHVDNCTKPKYINHCISEVYGEDAKDICIELNQYMMSSQALVFLIEFLRSHNPHLIEKIRLPSFTFKEGYVLLANHTLKQLNIIKDNLKHFYDSSTNTGLIPDILSQYKIEIISEASEFGYDASELGSDASEMSSEASELRVEAS